MTKPKDKKIRNIVIEEKPVAVLSIHGAAEMNNAQISKLRHWLIKEAVGVALYNSTYSRTYRARLYKDGTP